MTRIESMVTEYTRLPGTQMFGDQVPGVGPILRVLHDGETIVVDRSNGERIVTWKFWQGMSDPLGHWVEV